MKYIFVLGLLSACVAATVALLPAQQIVPAAPAPAATLAQDLEELRRFMPKKPLRQLITRYLLNDAEFQAVIRTINSYDAFMVRMRFRSQPEVVAFNNWVRTQLMLSGSSMESFEVGDLELFNKSPYWSYVYGWQGFINEFLTYYPQELIRAQVDAKVAQNGPFTRFWSLLKAIEPAYNRVCGSPEAQRVIAQLQSRGVNTSQVDQFIRTQLAWNTTAPAAGSVPAPLAQGYGVRNLYTL